MTSYTDAVLEAIGVGPQAVGSGGLKDIDEVLRRATQYSVFPTVYSVLKGQGVELPASAQGRWREQIASIALIRSIILEIQTLLGPEVPSIILKGEALGRLLYDDSYKRSTGDVDLLVDPENVEKVWRILESAGYTTYNMEKPREWTYNQFAVVHPKHRILIEIHWAIAFPTVPTPSTRSLFAQTNPIKLSEALTVQTLNPENLYFQLAYHYHQHEGFLKGLLDIAAWLDRFETEADVDLIARTARELGVAGVLQWPLHTIYKLTGKRSVLYEEEVSLPVKWWSELCCSVTSNCLIRSKETARDLVILQPIADISKAEGVLMDSMAMLTVDGISPKIVGFLRPWVWGPHRVGRFLYKITRPLADIESRVRRAF